MTSPIFLGPRTLSWRAIAVVSVIGLLAAGISSPTATPLERIEWLGAAVVAQVGFAAVYLAARALGLNRYRLGVLAAVVIASAVRGAVLATIVGLVDAGDPLDATSRVVSATVTFTGWSIIVGAALQASLDYRDDLRALLSRVDRTVQEADDFTRTWNERLASTSMSPLELAATASELQQAITNRLRPLSHRLWFGMTQRESRRRLVQQLGEDPPPLAWIAAIGVVVYLWNAAYRFGILSALAASIFVTAAPVLTLMVGNLLARRHPEHAVRWRWLSFAVAPVTAGLASLIYYGIPEWPTIAVVIIADVGIILASQTTAVSIRRRREVLAELGERVDVLDDERQSVASHLHSTVQSRWNAAALQFQLAAESGDTEQAQRALAETREILSAMTTRPSAGRDLQDIADAWEGIASVRLDVAPDIPTAPSSTISQLVDEAVANAVRHGRARHVDVMVRVAGDAVEVVVADDGVGVADDAQPGLGSSWRDQVSTWELVNADRGARLTARIPISGG